MKIAINVLIVSALVCTCDAGVQGHAPQTLQTALNLFDWLSNLFIGAIKVPHGGTKYGSNVVTRCPPNVMFVLDGSDSISPIGFTYTKSAAIREIRAVTQAFSDVHIGIILFSSYADDIAAIKPRNASEIEDIIKLINSLKQPRTSTRISSALMRARQNLINYSAMMSRAYNGDRSGNIIVLVSDGQTNGQSNYDIRRATIQEAKIAQNGGILTISLSVEEADVQFLQDISQVVQEYRTAISWSTLVACPRTILPPVTKDSGCRDIVFVVDGSDSVLSRQDIVRNYLAYAALRYRLATNAVGVIVYGTDPTLQRNDTRLQLEEDKLKLAEKIRLNLKFPKTGGTGSDKAITQAIQMLDNSGRGRPGAMVLITDGPPLDPDATRQAIERARSRGCPVIIISVGTALTAAEVNELSGGLTTFVHNVSTFADLYSVDFDNTTCQAGNCIVTNKSCSSPYVYDLKSCSCVCPTTCQIYQSYDAFCNCVCPNKCPTVQTQDAQCNCACPNKCTTGQTQDAQCNCACPNKCPIGQTQDAQCNCACPNKCPTGQTQDAQCNCACPNKCPTGQTQDAMCNCACPNKCPTGLTQDVQCSCACPNKCPTVQTQDAQCNCACPNKCTTGQTQDAQCNCACPNKCPIGQTQDAQCNCACPNKCPTGQTQDAQCNCACPNKCPTGQTQDAMCNCACPNKCPTGLTQDVQCSCACPNKCPTGQTQDAQCNCACPNKCPTGETQDAQCNCACTNKCPTGQTQDAQCNCACPNKCPTGQTQDAQCNCACPNKCPTGQTQDAQCNCACPNKCPTGQTQDAQCNCACPNKCPTGQTLDAQCNCACPNKCPTGQTQDAQCNCACPNKCPTGQTQDAQCNCACPNKCPTGQTQDAQCNCACPNKCPTGQTQDAQCNCACPNNCPTGQTQDAQCNCACPNKCPNGQTQDAQCNCACPNKCPTGQTQDAQCNCACPNKCPTGQTQDAQCNCACPNKCPTGQTQDAQCNCACPNKCPTGQTQDAQCNCACPNKCPTGQTQDAQCNCACPNKCPTGQTQDAQCNCACPNKCPTGQTQDAQCNCACPNKCPTGQTQDAQCNCACPNKCPTGQTQDAQCNCACPNKCPTGQTQDAQCNCACPNKCPTGQTQDAQCKCNCPNKCSVGQAQDAQCNCACPNKCPVGEIQDVQCNCTCTKECPSGKLLENCTCLPCSTTCPLGQILSSSCQCLCPNTLKTPHPKCGCVPQCASSLVYNYTSCSCVGLCDNCFYNNGQYQAGLPGHCNQYVDCIPKGVVSSQGRPESFTPLVRDCGPGTYYIRRLNGWIGCDYLSNGVCIAEMCQNRPSNARFADDTACQSYWQCKADTQLPTKECCPAGYAFDGGSQTCLPSPTCQVTCISDRSNSSAPNSTCLYAVTLNDPNEFFYPSLPNDKLRCSINYIMDLSVCRCVPTFPSKDTGTGCVPKVNIDFETAVVTQEDSVPRISLPVIGQVGNFSGNQDLVLKMFADSGFQTDYFQINLKLYLPTTPSGTQRVAVVTNADCSKKESVSITMDNKNFYFKIYQLNLDREVEVAIPYAGAADSKGWYEVTLVYQMVSANTFELSGKVGNNIQKYQGPINLTAYIDVRTCALHLGYGFNYSSLVAYVDNLQVWTCNPNTILKI